MEQHLQVLLDPSKPVHQKYIAIFELKQIGTPIAIQYLIESFLSLAQQKPQSVLLLHEIAYALGQLPKSFSHVLESFLLEIINNPSHDSIVRHEAVEAIVNLCPHSNKELLEKYSLLEVNDNQEILADTCRLGLKKIETYEKQYSKYALSYEGTIEPAAPYTEEEMGEESEGGCIFKYLNNPSIHIFNKYRALYYIRNQKNKLMIQSMAELLKSPTVGALMKHEISFILGQLGTECPIEILPILVEVSMDPTYPPIARHETLAAFQTIHSDKEECRQLLTKLMEDPEQVVRETASVSLNLQEFWC